MPETGIALFPDVGASYFLPRLRGSIGLYMALVGARLTGADAAFAGLATHYTDQTTLAGLPEALAEHGVAALCNIARPFDAPIANHMASINHCFSARTISEVLQRLQAADTEWSRQILLLLHANSPSALHWTLRLVQAGATCNLAACGAAELPLTDAVPRHPDFAEGGRARLVDKDRTPRWTPAGLDDVNAATIDAMFQG